MTRTLLSTASPELRDATGRGVRIAVVDSGIAPGHPHVGDVSKGIALVGDDPDDTMDRVGHGTAVAAAIREKAPDAELIPVRVLDRQLATSARVLARAIVWAVNADVHIVNLSLGTSNVEHVALFEEALRAAAERGVLVVSAARHEGVVWYPGGLVGAVGIVAATDVSRDGVWVVSEGGRVVMEASPYPRPIDGVPVERNLSGVSFAVANACGLLGRVVEVRGVALEAWKML